MAAPRPPDDPLALAKRRLRAPLRERRAAIPDAERAARSLAAAWRFLEAMDDAPEGSVALFRSLPGEIDAEPLAAPLAARGRPILLPRQVGRGLPLSFHLWAPGEPLVPGPFGVLEPPATAPTARPAVMAVPLLAFDARGNRLGYGAGFYDRTLASLRESARGPAPLAVGLAFDLQELAEVPAAPTDEPLNRVATETRVLDCGRARTSGGAGSGVLRGGSDRGAGACGS